MGRNHYTLSFETTRCIGIVKAMTTLTHLICLKSFVMRCFGIVRTIPTSSSSWPTDHTLILWCVFYRSLRRLWLSLWGRHCLETTLFYIVDWLLQWSKDFSDTSVFGWPTLTYVEQNILFYIEVWSCEMISLCGKLIWRWNVMFWLCLVFRRRLYRHFVWITSFLRS